MDKNTYWYWFILTTLMLTLSACFAASDNVMPLVESTKTMHAVTENTSLPVLTNTPSPVPTDPVLPTSQPEQDPASVNPIIWKATHETGDISEWQQHGDFINQGQSAYFSMVTPFAHSGKYSISLTIDTEGPSNTGSHAAYLFFWDQLPEDAYYYSAWYYIPSGTRPQDWWNIWQWKSTYNGDTDSSVPVYSLDVQELGNRQMSLKLIYRPDLERNAISYQQNIKTLPHDQWVHIEAYYQKATNETGKVIVWQDGVEIFNLADVQTTMEDNTVYWSVNHYTDYILPNPSSIYIDDVAISTERIGPDYTLPY
jgi:Polysaccharide lyase